METLGVVTDDDTEHPVVSNDDLLIEILLRLPVVSLVLFKTVSKRWLSLITSPNFTMRHSRNTNLDLPCGLYVRPYYYQRSVEYDFVSLDTRIPSKRSALGTAFNFGPGIGGNAEILQSCNGLFLRCSSLYKFFVCNPSANLFKILPQPRISNLKPVIGIGGTKMAFDPTKSREYKVIHAGRIQDDNIGYSIQIQTYSSETGDWSVCDDLFCLKSFCHFLEGIYWNGAIHWLNDVIGQPPHLKLDVMEHPVVTTNQIPRSSDGKEYHDCKLLESCGCLLFLGSEKIYSRQLDVFEMRNGNSEWSMKYLVDLDDIMTWCPNTWSMHSNRGCSTVLSIVLREREEESFLVMEVYGKAVQYKFGSKTLCALYDLGSFCPRESFQLFTSFAGV